MDTFLLRIMASDHAFYDGPCESLIVPTQTGDIGILAFHSNLLAAVRPGRLRWRLPGEKDFQIAAISAGMLKVEDGDVLILADSIERPEEIDANRARRKAEAAREILLQRKSRQEYQSAQATLARALNRLRIKSSHEGWS